VTTQLPDEVFFDGQWFSVTAVDGAGLFDPAAQGLELRWIHTACWRGHICRYAIVEQRLVLQDLAVGSDSEPPPIGVVRPQLGEFGAWQYEGVDLPVAFTGRLLIGNGELDDLPYLNMGFWPAWMFPEVYELTLRDGALVTAADCSAALAVVRADILAPDIGPDTDEPSGDWVNRTFSLAYDYSWPGRRERSPGSRASSRCRSSPKAAHARIRKLPMPEEPLHQLVNGTCSAGPAGQRAAEPSTTANEHKVSAAWRATERLVESPVDWPWSSRKVAMPAVPWAKP
jgi:hypothetical protein